MWLEDFEKLMYVFVFLLRASLVVLLGLLILQMINQQTGINEGEIYSLKYEPATQTLIMMPITHTDGKNITTTLIPMWIYDDEDYIVYIRSWNDDKQEFDTNYFFVERDVFETLEVGQQFHFGPHAERDDPDRRVRADSQQVTP